MKLFVRKFISEPVKRVILLVYALMFILADIVILFIHRPWLLW